MGRTDNGGSAHAALRFAYTGSGDSKVAKETTAGAPTPLCPPTPSLGHRWYIEKAGRNRLQRFLADALRHWKRPAPLCKHRRQAFPNNAPCFSLVYDLSSLTGRRFKGHVREKRRLGSGEGYGLTGGEGIMGFRGIILNKGMILNCPGKPIPDMIRRIW